MSGAAYFSWIGPAFTIADWNTPADWADVTTGQTPAVVAPGSLDVVTVAGAVLSGKGSAANVTFLGDDAEQGDLNIGTLAVGGTAYSSTTFNFEIGATVSATEAIDAGLIDFLAPATLDVSGNLQLGSASSSGGLQASNRAVVQAGDLTFVGTVASWVAVDATSSVEIGGTGSASAGALTIDQGGTVSGPGSFSVLGNLVDNGQLSGAVLNIGNPSSPLLGGTMSGAGTVEVLTGGDLSLFSTVESGELTIQLDGNATLDRYAPLDAGNIVMNGTGNEIVLHFLNSQFSTGATLIGFNSSDTLVVNGYAVSNVTYTSGTHGNPGTLTVLNGADVVTVISVIGDYGIDTFRIAHYNGDVYTSSILAVPDYGTPSAGTSGSDSYTWVGTSSDDWGTATNWMDVSAGQKPAVVAPGILDLVTVENSATYATISGIGDSASLTFLGNANVFGDLNTGALAVVGPASLNIDALGTVVATTATVSHGAKLSVDDGELNVADTLQIGAESTTGILTAVADGLIYADGLVMGRVGSYMTIDDTSTVEIGQSGTGAAGYLTVDQDHTVTGSGGLLANIVDDGLISSNDIQIGEPFPSYSGGFTYSMSGMGTLEVLAGGLLTFEDPVTTSGLTFQLDGSAELDEQAPIAAGNGIDLIGTANTLTIDGTYYTRSLHYEGIVGRLPTVAATINGFNTSDVLTFLGATTTITSAAYASGTLTVLDGTNFVASLNLAGNFDHETFNVLAGNEVVLTDETGGGTLCFCRDTLIATPFGQAKVQDLAAGDMVMTLGGAARPVVWIGTGRVLATRGRRGAATPVIVRKGALADNVPTHDLRVTKGHSFYVGAALIPVEFLVNHRSIEWDDRAQEVELYHIELETHDVLIANGAPAESYRDDGNRWLFRNANSGWDQPTKKPYAPVLTGGPIVDGVWQRLLERVGPRRGLPLTDDPDLCLVVSGERVEATSKHGPVHIFILPRRPTCVHIASRASAPAELGVARDSRVLGVALTRVVVRQGTRFRVTEAADERLMDGFHSFEVKNGLRWTDGDAVLPTSLFDGFDSPIELLLYVGGTTQYALCGESEGARTTARSHALAVA